MRSVEGEFQSLGPAQARLMAGMHRICFAEPWDEAAMAALLAMPGAAGVLASGERGPEGFILWRTAGDEAEVLTLLVLPPYRGQGLGGKLLDRAVVETSKAGAKAFFLEVAADNAAAFSLYSSRGFQQVGLRPRYYRGVTDALVMKRGV
jgi:ribosomal-protein-alanine N-acetyltransferase